MQINKPFLELLKQKQTQKSLLACSQQGWSPTFLSVEKGQTAEASKLKFAIILFLSNLTFKLVAPDVHLFM